MSWINSGPAPSLSELDIVTPTTADRFDPTAATPQIPARTPSFGVRAGLRMPLLLQQGQLPGGDLTAS